MTLRSRAGGIALLAGLLVASPARATSWIDMAIDTCGKAGVSPALAMSVILAESGGQPYAIRVNAGKGRALFPTAYEEASRLAEQAVRVTSNVDLGLMQVNYREWGRPLGLTPAQLLQPATNVTVGCEILKYALAEGGAAWQRVGRYHSPHAERQEIYTAKVAAWLQALFAPVAQARQDRPTRSNP